MNITAAELAKRTLERRAVEAAIWGMPIVSVDAMRQAFFRDAQANYNDIVFWSKPSDWKNQTTTPNASSLYIYFNFNTQSGPVVLEVPPSIKAGLFGLAFAPPLKLGEASFYLVTAEDAESNPLQGGNSYRLHIPPNVPAEQFWAITIYDCETAGFIRESSCVSLDSYNQQMQRNADGSVDVYFSTTAPAGQETNWISTASGKNWFAMFRFYGPGKPLFEKTWKLLDIEKTK